MRITADQASRPDAGSPGRTDRQRRRAAARPAGSRAKGAAGSIRRALLFAVPVVWVAALLGWELVQPASAHGAALLAATPALACAGTGARSGVWLGGGCALLALHPLGSVPGYQDVGSRAGIGAAVLCVAMASCYTVQRRARLTDELVRTREVATAAQQAVIRPLPPRIGRFTVAAGYLSAARGAAVGGDLYEAVPTAHGVRVVIGDVRGHGLQAVGTVAALLGSFREAAHDEPRLERVPHRLERALERHLAARSYACAAAAELPGAGGHAPAGSPEEPAADAGFVHEPFADAEFAHEQFADEEFVTVLLLEAQADGTVTAVNCGHPWPYRLVPGPRGESRSEPVSTAEPLPPLGMVPLPEEGPQARRLRLPPGEALFLFTDGAEDARDAGGRCFPLPEALSAAGARSPAERARSGRAPAPAAAEPPGPAALVEHVRRALLRHADGRLPDDVALLALCNDGCSVHGAGHDEPPERAGADARLACSCP